MHRIIDIKLLSDRMDQNPALISGNYSGSVSSGWTTQVNNGGNIVDLANGT